KMKKSGLKAAAIVSDLLTLVRRGLVIRKITNINLLVSEYLDSPEFEKLKSYHPDVEFETFRDENLWNMEGSPIHILKTIMNLISNGAESMSGKGKLTLTTRNQNITKAFPGYNGEITPGEYVVLEVTDTGSGMSPEDIENVFEPFYSKKVMGKSGTGLGMTVVWGTVKDHDGHIEIQSKEGQGTSISIYFPASRKEIVDSETLPNLEDYRGNGESILVIDDVPEQREVAVELLTTLGYSARALPNGETALQYLQDFPADLILLDMIMYPGMDGLDTYKEIARRYPSQRTIIATGYCETERVKQAQKLGCGNCLVKPFTLEKLGKTVKSELTSKRLL
ncbi:MAG: response regulator, partial [Proteobacteria bacterium]|nr:response regulator [Pseudomonadota bacterium]